MLGVREVNMKQRKLVIRTGNLLLKEKIKERGRLHWHKCEEELEHGSTLPLFRPRLRDGRWRCQSDGLRSLSSAPRRQCFTVSCVQH
jgi:hypothetical protein